MLHVLTHSFPTRRSSDLRGATLCASPVERSHDDHAYANTHRDAQRYTNEYANRYSDCDAHLYIDRHTDVYTQSDSDRYADINIDTNRSDEHTSELQSLMRISYAVFCLKKKTTQNK